MKVKDLIFPKSKFHWHSVRQVFFVILVVLVLSSLISGINARAKVVIDPDFEEIVDPVVDEVDLIYSNTPVQEVLRSLARVSGQNIIIDDRVDGDITVELEGVAFETAFDKILDVKDLDYHYQEGVLIVSTPDRIDDLYRDMDRRIFTLEHISSEEGTDVLEQIMPDVNAKPLPDQGRIILTGLEDQIEEAELLLDDLDEADPVFSKTYSLEYLPSQDAAGELEALFPDLTVQPREAYGDVILQGSEEDVEEAKTLLAEIDRPQPDTRETYLPLHMEPDELKNKVGDIYPEEDLKITRSNGMLLLEGHPEAVADIRELFNEIEQEEEDVVQAQYTLDYVDIEEMKEIISELDEELSVQASAGQRSVIVRGPESLVENSREIVEMLDQPKRQVMLDVRIEEVSEEEMKERGISPGDLSDFAAIGIEYDDYLPTGIDVEMPEIFNLLDDDDAMQTVANPSLLSLDGEEARLIIGDEIPFEEKEVVEGEIETVGYEYEEVGITLDFTPTITADDTVTLDIEPEVSSITERGEELVPPEVQTRRFENTISLRDGQTFAVGGLIQDEMEETMREIPYLADLPLLGRLFSHTEHVEETTEIIIFITANIVDIMEDNVALEDIEEMEGFKELEEETDEDDKEESQTSYMIDEDEFEKIKEDKLDNGDEDRPPLSERMDKVIEEYLEQFQEEENQENESGES